MKVKTVIEPESHVARFVVKERIQGVVDVILCVHSKVRLILICHVSRFFKIQRFDTLNQTNLSSVCLTVVRTLIEIDVEQC